METMSVSKKGVEALIIQLNEMHEDINASAEYKNGMWRIDIVGQFHYTTTILEAIKFLQGVMVGIKVVKK